jgi:hypothetical protein
MEGSPTLETDTGNSVAQYKLAFYLTASVRFIAILYWRADFELDLQRYSVLASELLDTSLHSSAIRDTGFSEEI